MTDTRHALIIANERYDDRALKQLKAPGHDADALAEVLGDPQIGDFDVDVVSNQPSYVLRRRIEHFFSDRRRLARGPWTPPSSGPCSSPSAPPSPP